MLPRPTGHRRKRTPKNAPLWEPIADEPPAGAELLRRIHAALEIEPEDLDRDMCRIPGAIGYFGELLAQATADYLTAKHEREKCYARNLNDPNLAVVVAERLGKKPSLDQLKAEIELLPEYEEARRLEITAQARKVLLDKNVTALEKKAEMLQMLGAQRREEFKHSRERTVRKEETWPD